MADLFKRFKKPELALVASSFEYRNIVAAARPIRIGDKSEVRRARYNNYRIWQEEAWRGYHCVDEETEILTTQGWKHRADLAVGDLVRVMDFDNETSHWEPVLEIHQYDVKNEKMVLWDSRDISSLTTQNHRWPVKQWVFAPDPKTGKYKKSHLEKRWKLSGEISHAYIYRAIPSSDLPVEPKYSDAFVELVAWFYTEGGIQHAKGDRPSQQIGISQSAKVNSQYVSRIRECLRELYGKPFVGLRIPRDGDVHWREVGPDARGMVEFNLNTQASLPFLEVAPRKRVSLDFIHKLTKSQLELFINISLMADGMEQVLGQKHPDMLDAFELALILSGRSVSNYFRSDGTRILGVTKKTSCWVRPRRGVRRRVLGECFSIYSGTVWCPTTKSGTWLARRNGKVYYTGNSIGEVKYGVDYIANIVSQLTLIPVRREPGMTNPVRLDGPNDQMYWDPLLRLSNNSPTLGHEEMLRALTINFLVAGEAYLIGYKEDPTNEIWEVKSTREVMPDNEGGWIMKPDPSAKEFVRLKEDRDVIVRLWIKDPEFSDQPDSPMRGILASCEEVIILEKLIKATALSGMNAGLIKIPRPLTQTPPVVAQVGSPDEEKKTNFLDSFEDAITEPIAQDGSPLMVVPLGVIGDKEELLGLTHMTFARPFDAEIEVRLNRALYRIAQGLNLPPEIIGGRANINHWGMWKIDEDTIKLHAEPVGGVICSSLTVAYYWGSIPDRDAIIWYDTSRLTAKLINKDILEIHDRLMISDESARKRLGLEESEQPGEKEFIRRTALKRGNIDPALTEALLQLTTLLVATHPTVAAPQGKQNQPAPPHQPPPNPQGPPQQNQPPGVSASAYTQADLLRERIYAAADSAVRKACTRAGAQIRQRAQRDKQVLESIRTTPDIRVAAVVGPQYVRACGLEDKLLANWDVDLHEQFVRWCGNAGHNGHIPSAWEVFKNSMEGIIISHALYEPKPSYDEKLMLAVTAAMVGS